MTDKVGVIGYGSWATTLVRQLALKHIEVQWLVTNPDVWDCLTTEGRNPKYVRDAVIDMSTVTLCQDVNSAVRGCNYVLLACPSAFLKANLSPLTESLADKTVISAIKGIVPDECVTVLEFVHDRFGIPFRQMGLVSGPSHAEEVSRDADSYITAVGYTLEEASKIAELFNAGKLRIDLSTDIYGIEYAGVLKNIYAIAAGLASGLGYGDNFLAVLVARAAQEMKEFMTVTYPFDRHVTGRAYLGDLLVTCYSNFSRNRRLGQLIGKGCTVKSALNEMTMIAEGYYSAGLIRTVRKKFEIDMPIADMVGSILYGGVSPRKAMRELAAKL